MPLPGKNSLPERRVVPLPLLAGVVLGFLGCTLAGRVLSRVNCLHGFGRFHVSIDWETRYYPTVSQVRSLARAKLRPDKVAVVLGGNSVLMGYGQGAVGNWTRHLQLLLGDDFQVLNLALPSGEPFEFGSVVAEGLLPDHPRLIFVTNTWPWPQATLGDPDGRPLMRYFYWQAQARGLLADHPGRDAVLRRLEGGRDESFRELRRQCALDARLSFHDLWNAATYRCFCTVWCPVPAFSWTRPRGYWLDLDPILPPAEERQLQAVNGRFLPELRDRAVQGRLFFPPPGREEGWREPDSPLPQSIRECVPPDLRCRTLVLLNHHCPYYLRQLTAQEREGCSLTFAATARMFRRAGVRAAEVGGNIPQHCYSDRVHLTTEGGRLLAEEAAPLIRELAEQLGYTPRAGRTGGARAKKVEALLPGASWPVAPGEG